MKVKCQEKEKGVKAKTKQPIISMGPLLQLPRGQNQAAYHVDSAYPPTPYISRQNKGGIHGKGERTAMSCGSANCCGSTISLEVGKDSSVWWRAVGAFVSHKIDQEALKSEQKRLRVEESSMDVEPSHDLMAELEDTYREEAADN